MDNKQIIGGRRNVNVWLITLVVKMAQNQAENIEKVQGAFFNRSI